MSDDILIFDRQRLRANRLRAAAAPCDFLHQWTACNLADRLTIIKRDFPRALLLGAAAAPFIQSPQIRSTIVTDLAPLPGATLQADHETLPFAPSSFDLVLSALDLHTINDLPGALLQIRQALKPDGLFLAAMFGGETLHELRQVMTEAEALTRGGVSPRIFPFADKPQCGGLLQRAGFSLPVVDSEIVTVTYDNVFKLMHDLRAMGEGNVIRNRDKTFPGRDFFMETARLYQEKFADIDGRIRATFEIIFMIGWAPHASQQKPQPRGSATHSLADILS